MSAPPAASGRENQKLRTRKALLDAASRLLRKGAAPTIEEVAEEALVSRATAYRYFPSPEALMLEAAVHLGVPQPDELFDDFGSLDATARLLRVDEALHEAVRANEKPLRLMLASLLQQSASSGAAELPARQNRRSDLIGAALGPSVAEFAPQALEDLSCAVAILVGTEGFVAAKDVLGLDDAAARRVKRWAIAALVDAARRHSSGVAPG